MSDIIKTLIKTLPDDVLEITRQISQQEDAACWRYGYAANEAYRHVVANDLPYTRLETCGAISYLAGGHRTAATILGYAKVQATFYGPANSDSGTIPFSHYQVASEYKTPAGRQMVLRTSRELFDKYSYPVSAARLRAELDAREKGETVVKMNYRYKPTETRLIVQSNRQDHSLDTLKWHVAQIGELIENLRINNPRIASHVAAALIDIQDVLREEGKE